MTPKVVYPSNAQIAKGLEVSAPTVVRLAQGGDAELDYRRRTGVGNVE